jgi:protein gp37
MADRTMSANTSIEWTDHSWNPLRGTTGRHTCVRISPGCTHCYAATMNKRFGGPDYIVGADTPRLDEKALLEPLRWRKPRKVFVCSMTDLFLESHKEAWIDQVLGIIGGVERHTFQVLTKRADRMHSYMNDWVRRTQSPPPRNLWLGVSCENQQYADERIPLLLQTPAAVRWVSAEPLLGPLQLAWEGYGEYEYGYLRDGINWVVVGGESGPGARPFDLAWGRSIVQQCKAAGVACFVKQLGAKPLERFPRRPEDPLHIDGWTAVRNNATDGAAEFYRYLTLKNRKGGDIAEWPPSLRVREYPRVEVPA